MSRVGKGVWRQQLRRDSLLQFCITALAAGAVVALGHWFSSSQGRRIGGDKRRLGSAADSPEDEESRHENQTSSKGIQPMSLADLRRRRLKAVEARLNSSSNEPSATTLTPLGRILKLAERADKLEEETRSFLEKVWVARVINPSQEKEQEQLLELLTLLQMEIDGVPGDESVRPLRKSQTNRIQTLIGYLEELERQEKEKDKEPKDSPGTAISEVGRNLTSSGSI